MESFSTAVVRSVPTHFGINGDGVGVWELAGSDQRLVASAKLTKAFKSDFDMASTQGSFT